MSAPSLARHGEGMGKRLIGILAIVAVGGVLLVLGYVVLMVAYLTHMRPPELGAPEVRAAAAAGAPAHEGRVRELTRIMGRAGFRPVSSTTFDTCLDGTTSEERGGAPDPRCVLTSDLLFVTASAPAPVDGSLLAVDRGIVAAGWQPVEEFTIPDVLHFSHVGEAATRPNSRLDSAPSGARRDVGDFENVLLLHTATRAQADAFWLEAPDIGGSQRGDSPELALGKAAESLAQEPTAWLVEVQLESTYFHK